MQLRTAGITCSRDPATASSSVFRDIPGSRARTARQTSPPPPAPGHPTPQRPAPPPRRPPPLPLGCLRRPRPQPLPLVPVCPGTPQIDLQGARITLGLGGGNFLHLDAN